MAGGAIIAPIIPPSIPFVLFGVLANVSITKLFLAGIVPAVILTVCNLVAAYAVAVRRGYPSGTFPGWRIVGQSFVQSIPGLLVVVICVSLGLLYRYARQRGKLDVGPRTPCCFSDWWCMWR